MASHLLWAHLLRKDATTDTPCQVPPIAPQDKAGTSIRMLIHDTQANLEKFSTRLDALLTRVDDCRAQVVNANKLLDVERDKVLSEILEIAHRCQAEMKAHVGTPAQAPTLDLVHASQASTEKSVQALEKRIDALQTILQSHTHAMQSIQDQQTALMGVVLPLVHGISPQMDQIKTALTDMVANAVSTMTNSVEHLRSTMVTELAHTCPRSSMRVGSRPDRPTYVPEAHMTPLDSFRQLPHKRSRLAAPLTGPDDPPLRLLTPRTPRQPLADLLIIPRHRHPTSRGRVHSSPIRKNNTPKARQHPNIQVSTITRRCSRESNGLPIVAESSDRDATSRDIKIEEILEANFTGVISVDSSPLSSPPLSAPRETRNVPCGSIRQDEAPSSFNPEASPPKSMSLRDRRAQMSRSGRAETRRFIPLVPWSDEEE